jgi:UrcA family protein
MNAATRLAFLSCLKPIIATTTLLALGVIGPADASVTRSAKVSIKGLDLSMPEGARAARERLRQAARKLCAQVADELDLSHHANYVACVDQSVAKALQQVAPPSIVAGSTATSAPKSRP